MRLFWSKGVKFALHFQHKLSFLINNLIVNNFQVNLHIFPDIFKPQIHIFPKFFRRIFHIFPYEIFVGLLI